MSKARSSAALKAVAPIDTLFPATQVIDRRVTMKMLVSAYYSLLQGDPDNNNAQRVDLDGYAFVTPMGFKRKVRDTAVRMGFPIHVARGSDLSAPVLEAARHIGVDIVDGGGGSDDAEDEDLTEYEEDEKPRKGKAATAKKSEPPPAKGAGARGGRKKGHALKSEDKDAIIKQMGSYFDFRLFGGVLTSLNHGEAGAVQVSFGVSQDKVQLLDQSITRVAVANEKEREKKDRTMGTLKVLQYGLFGFEIAISPWSAERTGMTWGDYTTLLEILKVMWDNTKSTGRNKIVVERMVSFIHSSPLGDAQDARLCDLVQATLKTPGSLPRSAKDYAITIDNDGVPEGIQVIDNPV